MELNWDLKKGILDKLGLRNLLAKKINLAILKKKNSQNLYFIVFISKCF